ncbi:hypothetical protein [Streptomyces sp. SID5643]|uniref:hypothetical protein n=1 Tax=Streptomyces sp. SID5643 TaxID=2690307 RepID=UPI00136992B6|nr:hypothetical protein [Streptomyces sp. SID5643]MZF90136.1 hypothetical protein [Streptomyces sp. SID5643]
MSTSTLARRVRPAAAALAAAAALTSCGDLHAPGTTPGASSRPSGSSSPSVSGASPYVEPGAGDGAPHYNENNAYRRAGEMTPAHAADAEREAARIRPVLKRLWEQRKWDPETVRAALLRLGYEEERVAQDGKRLGGTLTVTGLPSHWEGDGPVTPEGSRVALRVHDDACVTAFLQQSNFAVSTNGPYPETGCFQPPYGH